MAELLRSGGQDSRESFKERLKEIDIEMGRFDKVRALALENANAILFYHSKNSLYHYTILFYNTSTSQNSISIKILFFNLSILLLSNRHFFLDTNGSTITNHHTTTTTPHHTSTSMAPPSSITTPPPKCFSLSSYTLHNQKTQTYFSRPAAIDERRGTHEPRHRQSTPITIGKKKQKTKNKTKSTLIKTQTPPPLDQCFLHH